MDVIGELISIKIPSKKHLKCQILLSNLFQKGRSESNNKCAPIQRLRKKEHTHARTYNKMKRRYCSFV